MGVFVETKKSGRRTKNRIRRGPCHLQYRSKKRIPYIPYEEKRRFKKQASDLERELRREWQESHSEK